MSEPVEPSFNLFPRSGDFNLLPRSGDFPELDSPFDETPDETAPPSLDNEVPSKKYSPSQAWTPLLAQTGYVPVVRAFLDNYSSLRPYPLTSGEALFVIHLMKYKWGEAAPFPAYKTIAILMGISPKMARRHAQSLQQKGYLIREVRKGRPNLFDLRPLFTQLEKRLEARPQRRRRKSS
jgi:hypothetical protein